MSHQGFHGNLSSSPSLSVAPRLRLEEVSLRGIGTDLLLEKISFVTQPGEILGLVGASGSGKTSLLRLLNGLVSHSSGRVSLDRQPLEFYSPTELRRRLVLVPQEPRLLGMNVKEALSYPLKLQARSPEAIEAQIAIWTDLLRIPQEWLAKTELQLSLGQRQLVAIARGLMLQPQIILLDEPTSALDIGIADRVLKVLQQLNQEQNLTIIMVNHQLEAIQNFCDRILLLERGRLLQDLVATPANWQQVGEQIRQLQSKIEQEWL